MNQKQPVQKSLSPFSFIPAWLILVCWSFAVATFSNAAPAEEAYPWAPGEQSAYERYLELKKANQLSEAISACKQWVSICETHHGRDHQSTSTSLDKLAGLYQDMGDYPKAERLYLRSLKINETKLGPDHPDTATTLKNLALLYESVGDYAKAEPLYLRALKINETKVGPDHPDTVTTLNQLAGLYRFMGDYPKAERLFLRSLRVKDTTFGPDHAKTATSLHNLAVLYKSMGDYAKAEPLLLRSLKIFETKRGPDHPRTAATLNELAELYRLMGDYTKAEPLFQRALKINEPKRGPDHLETAKTLNNLGLLYHSMGDYAKAEPLYLRALKICGTKLGPNHPETVPTLNNLAVLYRSMSDYGKAELLYLGALNVCETKLGPGHPYTANSLRNLAVLYRAMGDYAKAEPLYLRALKINETKLGPDHPDTGLTLNNLAVLYRAMGDYAKAEPLLLRSLNIDERKLGPDHPHTAVTLNNLAVLYLHYSDRAKGLGYARKMMQANSKHLRNILSFTTESQRFAFQRKSSPYDVIARYGEGTDTANAVLLNKGIVLESILEDRRVADASGNADLANAAKRLSELKAELKPMLMGDNSGGKNTDQIQLLQEQLDNQEKELARQVNGIGTTRQSLSITVGDVAKNLPSDMALVEYFRYYKWLDSRKGETSYGAVVIRRRGEPLFVSLGSAQPIEDGISSYRNAIEQIPLRKIDEAKIRKESRNLYDLLIGKMIPKLDGIKKLIISPDGALNFLSFATLLNENEQFLSEKLSVYYVASGRDLIPKERIASSMTPPFLIGDPDFAMALSEARSPALANKRHRSLEVSLRSGLATDSASIKLSPLPGTRVEVARVDSALQSIPSRKGKVNTLLGSRVTEQAVRCLKSPEILHLATHGFFLADPEGSTPGPSTQSSTGTFSAPTAVGAIQNPMFRSGIALSGAENTLNQWQADKVPDPSNDGILLAAEIADLDLRGTKLVTLSACKTAIGEFVSGEGILGMRRAFVMAGAQNVLMTLWEILDEPTPAFMEEFYRRYDATGNAPEALAQVQREWLVRLRKESGLGYSIYVAGGFVMSAQATPVNKNHGSGIKSPLGFGALAPDFTFIEHYLKLSMRNGDLTHLGTLFDSEVNHFGTLKSRKTILQEELDYHNKWPQRNFDIQGPVTTIVSTPDIKVFRYQMHYAKSNSEDPPDKVQLKKGILNCEMTLTKKVDHWVISCLKTESGPPEAGNGLPGNTTGIPGVPEARKLIVRYQGDDGVNIRETRSLGSDNLLGTLFRQPEIPLIQIGQPVVENGKTWVEMHVTGWIPVSSKTRPYLSSLGAHRWKVIGNDDPKDYLAMRTGPSSSKKLVCKLANATVIEALREETYDGQNYIYAEFNGWSVMRSKRTTFIRPIN